MKKRLFKTKQEMQEIFTNYFTEHRNEVFGYLLDKTNKCSMTDLRDYEYNMGFGSDCGFVYAYPLDKGQEREWRLDNGKYDIDMLVLYPYPTQSTTLQSYQLEKAISDLGLKETFRVKRSLD